VCTDPARRGEGLARRACTRIMQLAVEEGAPAIVLEMYVANDAGRRTYEALGFHEVGRYRSGLLRGGSKPR
jgi:ribosomal protein S18 acetylase RimI-like enzyme